MIRLLSAILTVLAIAGVGGGLAIAQEARTCSQFASQTEAQAAYAADPTDPAGNDEDGDGIACENVIYGNSTTALTPLRRIGAAGMTGSGRANGTGVGASGIVPAAQQANEPAGAAIGAAGMTQPNEMAEGGAGAAGITPAPDGGIGESGLAGGQRDAVVRGMTGMPNTGTGVSVAGSWLAPAAFLLAAVAAAWASVWSGTGEWLWSTCRTRAAL